MRTTVLLRGWRSFLRNEIRGTAVLTSFCGYEGCALVSHGASGAPSGFSGSIAYGSRCGAIGPGVSIVRESMVKKPSGSSRTRCDVPRTSLIDAIGSRRPRRCAISTICRSPLPYTSRSAPESSKIERRTLSDQ
jgi:hypothetical protein